MRRRPKPFPGVKHVVQISRGVAVVADNTWSAMQGRKALEIKWDEGAAREHQSSAAISKIFAERAQQPGRRRQQGRRCDGRARRRREEDRSRLRSAVSSRTPPMEPMNCTADVRADGCEVWASTQMQTLRAGRGRAGHRPEARKGQGSTRSIMGGGFGRRGMTDYRRRSGRGLESRRRSR